MSKSSYGAALALLSSLFFGCADPPSGRSGEPSISTAPQPALTPEDLDRYLVELGRVMPQGRKVGAPRRAAAGDIADVVGFDHVVMAKRGADGTVMETCVNTVDGAMQFLTASPSGGTQ